MIEDGKLEIGLDPCAFGRHDFRGGLTCSRCGEFSDADATLGGIDPCTVRAELLKRAEEFEVRAKRCRLLASVPESRAAHDAFWAAYR
jgi:hypothetical protein